MLLILMLKLLNLQNNVSLESTSCKYLPLTNTNILVSEPNTVPNFSAWGSSTSQKKTLQEIQSEEVSHNKKVK